MFKKTLLMAALIGAFALVIGWTWAANQERAQEETQIQTQAQSQDQTGEHSQIQTHERERIYGGDLMTRRERNEYRNKMRAAKTKEEREQVRNEHDECMKLRAKERGITLPIISPVGAGGMMGPSGGMASGSARNR